VPTFAATLDSLEPIRAFVGAAAARAGLDSSATYRLSLAVDEVATNVVMHGDHDAGQEPTIELDAIVEDGSLVVRMSDSSAEYDPDDHLVDQAELQAPLEERVPGGLGLFLVRQNVDEFRYQRIGERNVHDFRVRLP
jgi:anti-sigma regulatory factor (Ser/Thr protein kinase)